MSVTPMNFRRMDKNVFNLLESSCVLPSGAVLASAIALMLLGVAVPEVEAGVEGTLGVAVPEPGGVAGGVFCAVDMVVHGNV